MIPSKLRAKILLLLFEVQCAATKPWAVLLELQFFTARLADDRVVVVAGFLANQEDSFGFLFALGHVEIEK